MNQISHIYTRQSVSENKMSISYVLNYPISVNRNANVFNCETSGCSFSSRGHVNKQVNISRKLHKLFKNDSSIFQIRGKHQGIRPHRCVHCGASFSLKYSMIRHIGLVHLVDIKINYDSEFREKLLIGSEIIESCFISYKFRDQKDASAIIAQKPSRKDQI